MNTQVRSTKAEYTVIPDRGEDSGRLSKEGTRLRIFYVVVIALLFVVLLSTKWIPSGTANDTNFMRASDPLLASQDPAAIEVYQSSMAGDHFLRMTESTFIDRGFVLNKIQFGNKFENNENKNAGVGSILVDESERYQVIEWCHENTNMLSFT